MNNLPVLSIIVPCFNEELVLQETSKQLSEIILKLINRNLISDKSFILCVNDGSKDNTWGIIKELYSVNSFVAGVNLAGNVGHQNALLAGLTIAKDISDVTVSIDADLQDDVGVIVEMLQKYHDGFDIVYGVRKLRKTDTIFKRITALGFYKLMAGLGAKSVYNHADYRLMSKRAVDQLLQYRERNLFLRGIVTLIGYNDTTVLYDRKKRFAGESKYPLKKMMDFAMNGITSFSVKPIHLVFGMGLLFLIITLAAIIYTFIAYLKGVTVAGWTSLMLSVWLIGSFILISLGIIGEYLGKIYIEVKDRPRYNIESVLLRGSDIPRLK